MISLSELDIVLWKVRKIKLVRIYEFLGGVQVTKTTTHYSSAFFTIPHREAESLHVVSIKSTGKGKFEVVARMTIYE